MNGNLERARLLLEQGRYELAIEHLQPVLSQDPNHPEALTLLAMAECELKRYPEAQQHARAAVAANPEDSFGHFTLARILFESNRLDEAEDAIHRALELDPDEARNWLISGLISYRRSRWREAAEAARRGLECDPDDPECANLLSMAQMQLGQLDEAQRGLLDRLQDDPENPTTLANLGWSALRRGERQAALDAFQEALRLDPEHGYARRGLLEALRLRYPLYGLILRFFLKMGTLGRGSQWLVILGLYFGSRLLRTLARTNEALRPIAQPLWIAYLVFVYLTWTARPLTNLLLRLNRYGRMVLDREETLESSVVGALVGGALSAFGVHLVGGSSAALTLGVYLLTLVIPVSAILPCEEGWPRRVMTALAAILALLGGLGVLLFCLQNALGGGLLVIYVVALLPCQIAAVYLMSVEPRR